MKELRENLMNTSNWAQCPEGELGGMVRRIKGRRHKVFAVQLGAGAAFGILLGLAFVTFTGPKIHNFGGITCADVEKYADAYIAGRLDPELKRQIDAHLAECPFCGPRFRQIIEDHKTKPAPRTTTQPEEERAHSFAAVNTAFQPTLASTP